MDNLIPLAQYAEKIGKAVSTVQQKCQRGTLPGAVKLGRDWFVPEDAEYPDSRITSGKYIDARKKK